MEFIRVLSTFLWAVVDNWAGYCTGGVMMALLWLWSMLKTQPIPRKVGIGVALLFLLLAFFNAWRDQYDRVAKLTGQIDKDRPDFIGEIDQITFGDSPETGGSSAFVLVTLINKGSPSVVDGFAATVDTGEHHIENRATWINAGLTLYGPNKTVIAKFQEDDNLVAKINTPIPQGGRVRGWLFYNFKGVSSSQLDVGTGAKWTITFSDYLNREYKAVPAKNFTPGQPKMFPGARYPFHPNGFKMHP
jgi:hypothetical protein